MEKPKPQFCPLCGKPLEVVRHIMANSFEIMCESCKVPCIVMTDDFVKLSL